MISVKRSEENNDIYGVEGFLEVKTQYSGSNIFFRSFILDLFALSMDRVKVAIESYQEYKIKEITLDGREIVVP